MPRSGSRDGSSDQDTPSNAKRKRKKAAADKFRVARIVDARREGGVLRYKTRWRGHGPGDDTWEPLEHVAATGHVDRYERRQLGLRRGDPGAAVIEYEDGERETVDLRRETWREEEVSRRQKKTPSAKNVLANGNAVNRHAEAANELFGTRRDMLARARELKGGGAISDRGRGRDGRSRDVESRLS